MSLGGIASAAAAPLATAPAVVKGLMVTGALAIASLAVTHSGITPAAIAEVIRDPASILGQRSPGARPAGALTQTKHARHMAALPATPRQRVLSEARTRPGAGAPPPLVPAFAEGAPAIAYAAPVPGVLPEAGPPAFGGGPGGYPVLPPVIGPVIGGGGGGGGGTPVTPQTPVTPVTPSAPVPEPQSWVLMILGFGLIGRFARRDRKLAAAR